MQPGSTLPWRRKILRDMNTLNNSRRGKSRDLSTVLAWPQDLDFSLTRSSLSNRYTLGNALTHYQLDIFNIYDYVALHMTPIIYRLFTET